MNNARTLYHDKGGTAQLVDGRWISSDDRSLALWLNQVAVDEDGALALGMSLVPFAAPVAVAPVPDATEPDAEPVVDKSPE